MRHLLACVCIFALALNVRAQDEISTEDPFALEPSGTDATEVAPAPAPEAEGTVLEEVELPAANGEASSPDSLDAGEASEVTIRGSSLIGLTEPKSVTGIISELADADGNVYRIIVAQPMTFAAQPVRLLREEAKEVMETVETAEGETKTISKVVVTEVDVDGLQASAAAEPPVFAPLLSSMRCFQIQDGIVKPASTSELVAGTHVLVTYSTADAMEVADGLYEAFNASVALTGLKPKLPAYLLALTSQPTPNETEPQSLGDFLKTASPYRGEATFFGDLELDMEMESSEQPLADYFQYPRDSELAWSYARRDFFSHRYDSSEPVLNSLIAAKTQEPMVYYLRGLLQYSRGNSGAAEVDFVDGAKLESLHGYSNQICRDLERIQGPARLALERHRRSYAK